MILRGFIGRDGSIRDVEQMGLRKKSSHCPELQHNHL